MKYVLKKYISCINKSKMLFLCNGINSNNVCFFYGISNNGSAIKRAVLNDPKNNFVYILE